VEAKPELETATRLDPKFADAWYLLGIIAKQAGETNKSLIYSEGPLVPTRTMPMRFS